MSSTFQKLKNSLGFKTDIDNIKSNTTPEVDSIAELYNLLLTNISRIDSLENITGSNNSTGSTSSTANSTIGGNAIEDTFYYQISNNTDTRPVFQDDWVTFGWDETGNDLEFTMDVEPGGSGDMRALAKHSGGGAQSTAIVTPSIAYDLWAAGVAAGQTVEVIISAENDETFPMYHVTVFNTGESYLNTIWIKRIIKL